MKTNAMRILDGLKIPYETSSYEDDGEHELAKGAAMRLSEKIGEPQTLNEENGWKYIYPSLDVYFGGKVAKYSIREIREDGIQK